MLVLTRRVGEIVKLGDDIEIEVLEVRPGIVRLGVRAPRAVRVLRGELVAEVATENTAALVVGELDSLATLRPSPSPVVRGQR